MLNSIQIKNFQSHNNSELVFSDGVNVIVGTSDSGKSAVLRAMNACITGDLQNAHRTYDTKNTEVTIEVDGNTITRRRNDKENEYQLNESYYRALNRSVPDDIVKVFNMNDLNIQYQLDGPFLLGETAGEVAKRLNKAVNLDIIDSSIKYVTGIRAETNSSLKHYTEQLANQTKELEQYRNIGELEQAVAQLTTLNESLEKNKAVLDRVSDIGTMIEQHTTHISSITKGVKNKQKVLALLDNSVEKSLRLEEYKTKSKTINNTADRLEKSYALYEVALNNSLNKRRVSTALEKLEVIDKQLNTKKELLDNLKKLGKSISDRIAGVVDFEFLIESKNNKLKEIMPDICPICGNKTKEGN